MFDERFRSLLQRRYLIIVKTPILRLYKGNRTLKFYTPGEFEHWKTKNDYKQWEAKYYKGLGTSDEADVKDDLKDQKLVTLNYDDEAEEMMDKAFNKLRSEDRKQWIESHDIANAPISVPEVQDVTRFIKDEYINYIIANIIRAIPRFEDGLKESQRKLLYGCLMKWGVDDKHPEKGLKKTMKEMKVAQLANYTAEQTDYHHGEMNLSETATAMGANFVGMSNMNYLTPKGQFGNRHGGMKAAANGRYIFTYPEWWVPYVYRCEDLPLTERNLDSSGSPIEPVVFYPIICMLLVNGANGIATGWSTFIPNHNPLDIIRWIQNKIAGKTTPRLVPWYRGFTGDIDIIDKLPGRQRTYRTEGEENTEVNDVLNDSDESENENDDEEEDLDENFIDSHTKRTMITKGRFEVMKNGDIEITELPISRWTNGYVLYIRDCIENGALKGIREKHTTTSVNMILQGVRSLTDKQLRITKSFGLSNMVAISKTNKPTRYDTAEDIMEAYYKIRLEIYEKRRLYMLSLIGNEIKHKNNKKLFIQLVITEKIVVFKRKRELIYIDMDKHKIPRELLGRTNLTHLSQEDIDDLDKEIDECKKRLEFFENIKPEELWMDDLNEFIGVYCKYYKCKYTSTKYKP